MLQHVGIEVRPGDVERTVELFELLGFARVEPPDALAGRFTWVEREGTQVHLMHEEEPVAPPRAHLAVVVDDFDAAVESVRAAAFPLEPGRAHWGAPRAVATAPGGNRVELMASPPGPP
jgi:hypothetical protein